MLRCACKRECATRNDVRAAELELGPAAAGAFAASGKVGSEGAAVSMSVRAV